jgi:hypothetical protein
MLLFFGVFSSLSRRERRWFWATLPSKPLMAGFLMAAITGTLLTRFSLPGLPSLPWPQTLEIIAYAMFCCLVVNDIIKVVMIKRLVPSAVA